MRILLTGRSGQVGGALLQRLRDHDVVAPDRASFDLENGGAIVSFIEALWPQLIINCAAYTAVDDAERDIERATQVNGVAPGQIAAAARTIGASLIHFSTDYVFDGSAREPYREAERCAPLGVYGLTKRQGEQAVEASGAPHLIVRTAWIYAPAGRNFLRTMLRLGAAQTSLKVVDDQVGAPTSAVVLAEIVARIVAMMVGEPARFLDRHGGILHATCGGQTSRFGFAAAIFDEARRRGARLMLETLEPVSTTQYPTPARRPAYSVLDLSRLRDEFGIAPVPWRQALAAAFEHVELPR